MARILIVENDRITAWALQRAVTRMGHLVVARTFSAAEAMAVVQADRPDVVLLDIGLRELQDGLLVGLDIQTFWSTPVIYLSGSDPAELGLQEFPETLWCYIAKPIDQVQLHDILAQLFPPPPPGESSLLHTGPDSCGRASPHQKCGVMLMDLSPAAYHRRDLFDMRDQARQVRLMRARDRLTL
jgi:CheY-like chemotaxis protein